MTQTDRSRLRFIAAGALGLVTAAAATNPLKPNTARAHEVSESDARIASLLGPHMEMGDVALPRLSATQVTALAADQCFPATGNCISGQFAGYWAAFGGLAIFGYPLSGEFSQILEDGKPYVVQYFERARFEMHPEGVMLGQFGRKIYNDGASLDAGLFVLRHLELCTPANGPGPMIIELNSLWDSAKDAKGSRIGGASDFKHWSLVPAGSVLWTDLLTPARFLDGSPAPMTEVLPTCAQGTYGIYYILRDVEVFTTHRYARLNRGLSAPVLNCLRHA